LFADTADRAQLWIALGRRILVRLDCTRMFTSNVIAF
jgi:hypothetical protein